MAGLTSTAWPFVIGVSVGWLILVALGRVGTTVTDGVIVSVVTVSIGMLLRIVGGQGIALPFVLVALGFLGAFMLGWRIVLRGLRHVRTNRTTA